MSYKEILVHLDGGRGQRQRLAVACAIARQQDAHLVGVYGVDASSVAGTAMPLPLSVADIEAMHIDLAREREHAHAQVASAENELRAAGERAGIAVEWRVAEIPVAPKIILQVRYADLAVLGQTDLDHPPHGSVATLVEDVLIGAGRPLLLVPYIGEFASVGRNVLVAWNSSREAARALGDALPLIAKAEATTVLCLDGASDADHAAATGVARYLSRHGISSHVSELPASGTIPVGELILSRAGDLGADLIVMGGYGHSRMRELVLGGVTRTLLQHMTVPVLMSH